jgi:hypothetical protein
MLLDPIDQWHIIEDSKISVSIKDQLIFDNDTNIIKWRRNQSFQQMVLWQLGLLEERIKFNPYLTPYTEINSKLIFGLDAT